MGRDARHRKSGSDDMHGLFTGTQANPFETFEGAHPDQEAAEAAARPHEDAGSFCAVVPLGFEAATYLTADPED